MKPAVLVEAIQDWGVEFRPYPFSDRPWHAFTTAGGWDPVGVAHHHTAGSEALVERGWNRSKGAMLRLLRIGSTARNLPGPLCHFAPAYMQPGKRVVYGIGWGNVNHAGTIDNDVAGLLRRGQYTGGMRGGAETVDGNSMLWGLEYLHPGDSTPWPDELLEAGHRTAAAICEAQGWTPKAWPGSQAEHRELTTRKIDRSWSGWGDGMRAEILRLAVEHTHQTPEATGWVATGKVQDAIRLLELAAKQKASVGRKRQAAVLLEHAEALREQFPRTREG